MVAGKPWGGSLAASERRRFLLGDYAMAEYAAAQWDTSNGGLVDLPVASAASDRQLQQWSGQSADHRVINAIGIGRLLGTMDDRSLVARYLGVPQDLSTSGWVVAGIALSTPAWLAFSRDSGAAGSALIYASTTRLRV